MCSAPKGCATERKPQDCAWGSVAFGIECVWADPHGWQGSPLPGFPVESMKPVSSFLLICLLGAAAVAQVAACAAGQPAGRAVIEGTVTKEPGSEPVKKALIELIAENQAEGGDYTAVSGPDGGFRIEGIVPGRYHLFAERTGLLEVDKHHARADGRVLTLAAGQEVKDLR